MLNCVGLAWASRGGVSRNRGEAGGYNCSWMLSITVVWYHTAHTYFKFAAGCCVSLWIGIPPHTHMMNTNNEIPSNSVNDRATQRSQLSPCNGTVMDQTGRGGHPTTRATSRNKYTKKDNRAILNCYYQSNPENIDYRRYMWELQKGLGVFEISEQRMVNQVITIIRKKWFTANELNEIRRDEKTSG